MSRKINTKFIIFSICCSLLFSIAIFYPHLDEPLFWENFLEIELEKAEGETIGQFFRGYHGNQWKPLTRITLYLKYLAFEFDALGYRICTLFFYILIGFLVIYFTAIITDNIKIALLGGILFLVHFGHWEIIVHTNANHHILMVFFYLLSLIFFVKYIQEGRLHFYVFSYLSCILCMLSSQTWVSLILVIFAIELLVTNKKFIEVINLRNLIKYIPFVLLGCFHVVLSIMLQVGKDTVHNPFASTSMFSIHAPVLKNLILYNIELLFPIISNHIPMIFKWIFGIIFLITMGVFVVKGKKIIKFYIFWLLISLFLFLFWSYDFPQSRYVFFPSIPFSVLICLLLYEGYQMIQTKKKQQLYTAIFSIVISGYIVTNILAYNTSHRVEQFHTSGRNHLILLKSFKETVPVIPDGSVIYISGYPKHNFYRYGQWTKLKGVNLLLPLFYENSFAVKIINDHELEDLLKNEHPSGNEIILRFKNMGFHLIKNNTFQDNNV